MQKIRSWTPFAKSVAKTTSIAAALAVMTSAAFADPILPAGSTAGLALGTALPQGVYFLDTATYFERSARVSGSPTIDAAINLPMIAWSTPWTILGGRLEVIGTVPQLAVGTSPNSGIGVGWGFSNFVGEIEAGRWRFKELLDKGGAAILQTDAAVCGGVTEFKKIAAMADCYGVNMCPHWFHDLHLHLVAAMSNGEMVEYFADDQVLNFRRIIDRQVKVVPGKGLALPTDPGLGYAFDEKVISKLEAEAWA